ncbi:MAG TPA: mandelate racemase/muconate lactonizing enzyme family protein [Acidimicrobiales bacterium]|jgi:L-alanine-DL-glutamate epimerase-like enolase superfamily enzyme|nr:isomerase [Actinomycetota bacterium]MDP6062918.1 mandelate racemase/muconate lactonizing enzyme family protein [Acidimicrobiales bacterium]MDP6213567.1 mandelate racemase/muconate lactonizing enzyme family protein [Acidimicrobiales bacterium]MDP7208982.1 mandelate racemase/muconate lactonizing enzyme family protein [Acidimicrobiales bacterium]HJL89240.1 mandelate racemase/muconate lactonizing enzyme family protein [Acidimicrobiales bacterium]|tara:strand:+ start:17496 stop:18722 length:1227 start_codon:yes stop_codon:yes gene_type:complete
MKVVYVETFVVGNPPPRHGGRYFIFVTLTTDGGVKGVGEAYVATVGPHIVAEMIEDVARRHLVGESPFNVESFWRRAIGSGYSLRPDPTLCGVISALEMACWDIIGKETGRPIYDLLGGRVHEGLRSYTYLYPQDEDAYAPKDGPNLYTDPVLAAEQAVREVERGFTAVKFDPAGPYTVFDGRQPSLERLDLSERYTAAIREAVGDRADLLFGTHGQFTPSGALRMARRLEAYDPLWFEEPVPPDDVDGMARVASGTTIPIATGERLTTAGEFAAVLRAGAASILQPNLGRSGGILQGKKIASMAEVHQALVAPHCYCGPVVAAANITLAACSPNFLILESIDDWGGFHADLLETPIRWEDGMVIPSGEPGLGVVLDEDVARAHPYEGDELHLTPDLEPQPTSENLPT